MTGPATLPSDLPRDILLFVAAYEERSFTAAAEREGATQSGVSQHIRKLEERFGARLFLREGGKVTPTQAGETYYLRCLDILRAHAAAGQTLRAFSPGLSGEVRVGLMPTTTRCVLAPALVRFAAEHPNVTVQVSESYSGELTERVRNGDLHFAVVPAFSDLAGLTSRLMATTPEVLVSRAGSAHGMAFDPLTPIRLVLPQRRNTRRSTIESYVQAAGLRVAQILELDSMFATLDLAATTDWSAILPGVLMARDAAAGRFTINPLRHPPLSLDLVAIQASRTVLPAAAEAFWAVLQQETVRASQVWAAPKWS